MPRKAVPLFTSVSLLLLLSAPPWAAAQQPASETRTQRPSSLVQPALDSVGRAGSAVDLNHWKGPDAIRAETDGNLASMQKDLQTALPPLLAAADAAPTSAAACLPVLLNLDALYSVLLRVSLAARASAPRSEAVALERAAALLDGARRTLGEAVLASAKAAEQRASELQAAEQQRLAVQQQAPVTKPTPAPRPKKKTVGSSGAH